MIYKERMTVDEMLDNIAKKLKNPSYSEAFVFPYIDRDLSKEEEDRLTSIVISLAGKIKQKNA